MIRRERKFYSKEFRERVLTVYYNSNESVAMIAHRFQVKKGIEQLGLPSGQPHLKLFITNFKY
ncbi:hypothetical protein EZS27_006649 [termite gut metagenome]|uniref:Transposase n=1 Tax=termite gut metagenome TaxID=433724 RepID=A0A5J4SJ70_9ZZZZ